MMLQCHFSDFEQVLTEEKKYGADQNIHPHHTLWCATPNKPWVETHVTNMITIC